MRAVEEPLPL